MSNLDLKITNAMERIEDLYHETNGQCYLSFSGGKDSTCVLALIKMCEDICTIPRNSIKAVWCDTGVELQATKDFVLWCRDNWYGAVEIIRPKKSFSWVLQNEGKPMKSKLKSDFISRYQKRGNMTAFSLMMEKTNKNGKPNKKTRIADKDLHILHPNFDIMASSKCCDILKKKPFKDYMKENNIKGYFTGIRSDEGGVRELAMEKRIANGGKPCTAFNGERIVKMPLIDWTDKDIEEFINKYNVPLSRAYTEYGMKRTGCMGCPFSQEIEQNLEVLYKYEPLKYKASLFFLKDVYIAQNVKLPFDEEYEREREEKWNKDYYHMRNEMLLKYRPTSKLVIKEQQTKLF